MAGFCGNFERSSSTSEDEHGEGSPQNMGSLAGTGGQGEVPSQGGGKVKKVKEGKGKVKKVKKGKGKFQVKKGKVKKVKKVKKGKKGKVKKGKGGLEAEVMEGSKGGLVPTSDMVGCGAHQRHGAKRANTEGVPSTIADANDGPVTPRRKPPLTPRKRPAGADCGEVSGLEDQTPVKEPIAMKTPATFAGRVRPENPESVVMWEGFRDIWNKEKTILKKTLNQGTFWRVASKYYNEVQALSPEAKIVEVHAMFSSGALLE